MQLPFAVIPLVRFVSDKRKMGEFVIPRWVSAIAWIVAGIIVALNVKLLFETFLRVSDKHGCHRPALCAIAHWDRAIQYAAARFNH
jgi:hypothetical protein